MTPLALALVVLLVFVVAWLLTGAVRRWALHTQLIDRPNERSSHVVPTPRGGGVAIVAAFALGIAGLAAAGWLPAPLAVTLLGAALPIAVVGFIDDRISLAARWRFGVHLLAAAWVLWRLGTLPPVPMFGADVNLGIAGAVLALAWLVWMTNLYNFMDGIDAIAGTEAVTVALGGALCGWLAGGAGEGVAALVLAAAAAGFLVWNLPPARIFMGDAGSGFLGITIGTLALCAAWRAPMLFWCWFILTGCFLVDATVTLMNRVARGERFYEAHRSHAYQYASRVHGSHRVVSLAVGLINVAWLAPWAAAVALGRIDGALAAVLAYLPLVAVALRYKAGIRAAQQA